MIYSLAGLCSPMFHLLPFFLLQSVCHLLVSIEDCGSLKGNVPLTPLRPLLSEPLIALGSAREVNPCHQATSWFWLGHFPTSLQPLLCRDLKYTTLQPAQDINRTLRRVKESALRDAPLNCTWSLQILVSPWLRMANQPQF